MRVGLPGSRPAGVASAPPEARKIALFSLDTLVDMLHAAGARVELQLRAIA